MSTPDPQEPQDSNHRSFFIRKVLIPIGCVAALIGLFYAVENIRGRNAWDSLRSELEAKGEVLEWERFIPKPIPDADNMLKVPDVDAWFVANHGRGSPAWFDPKTWELDLDALGKTQPTVGTLEFVSTVSTASVSGPGWSESLMGELHSAISLSAWSQAADISDIAASKENKITHLAPQRVDQLPRLNLRVQAATIPPAAEINKALARLNGPYSLQVQPGDSSARFVLVLTKTMALNVPDFLTKTDSLLPQFEVILEAAKRSGSFRTGDYSDFAGMPFPPYSGVRSLTRCAALRARCHLIQGQNERTLQDLELIQAARKTIGPTHLSLVAAMLDNVLCSLSLDVVRFGLDRHQWRASDLIALGVRAENEHLAKATFQALRTERAGYLKQVERWMEARPSLAGGSSTMEDKMTEFLLRFAPRGWYQQNMSNLAELMSQAIDAYDFNTGVTGVISPRKTDLAESAGTQEFRQSGPYHFYNKVFPTTLLSSHRIVQQAARTQTQASLTVIGCALERHRLQTGAFPENLESLSPIYLTKAPLQTVNGKPFLYRREADGGYSLWSVGWDLKDDGGKFSVGDKVDESKADWGWRMTKP